MDDASNLAMNLTEAAGNMSATVIAYLPSLLGALVLLLVGWIVARLLRAGFVKLGDGVNRLLDRFLRAGSLARMRLSTRALSLIGNVAFWIVILFFINAATEAAQLHAFSAWLDRVVAFLPTLFAGGLIMLMGYLLSALVRDLVSATVASSGFGQGQVLGAIVQGVIFLTGLVIGIDQIGVDITFLVTIVAIAIGAVLGSLSLAFGLGARSFVSNIIGAHYLQQQMQAGQMARVGQYEGEILEITSTSVVLVTAEGRTTIPAKAFNEETVVVMTPLDDDVD